MTQHLAEGQGTVGVAVVVVPLEQLLAPQQAHQDAHLLHEHLVQQKPTSDLPVKAVAVPAVVAVANGSAVA